MRYKRIRLEIDKMKKEGKHELTIFNTLYHEKIPKSDLINLIFGLI
jgi:hypothetical protein